MLPFRRYLIAVFAVPDTYSAIFNVVDCFTEKSVNCNVSYYAVLYILDESVESREMNGVQYAWKLVRI